MAVTTSDIIARESIYTYPVVVLGKSSTNFLGVIRAFGRRGIPVYTISSGPANASSNRSHYIREMFFVEQWDENALLKALLVLETKLLGNDKIVVLPTNDISLLVYSNVRNSLPGRFVDCIPAKPLIELSICKDKFYEYLAEREIPHPRSFKPDFINTHLDRVDELLSFPFLLKPAQSHTFVDRFQAKVFEIRNRTDFAQFYRLARDSQLEMLAQEMIPGEQFYMIYFYISRNRETIAAAGFRKVRQSPADYGTGSLVESFWDEKLITQTLSFLQSLNYTGVGELEYKYDPLQNEYKILEINARTVTFNRLCAALGLDMEYLFYLDAIGELNTHHLLKPLMVNIKWADMSKDLTSLARLRRDKKITWRQAINSYCKLKVEGYFAVDDPVPFVTEMFAFVEGGMRRIFRRDHSVKKRSSPEVI
jgi:predicted ATP-grasp superfamily ATP-dependent carboligase